MDYTDNTDNTDNTNNIFNLTIFTDVTKKICMCSATSIFIIVLFIITPLSNFFKTSIFMKCISLIIMIYIIYLNNKQINLLKNSNKSVNNSDFLISFSSILVPICQVLL